MNNQLIARMLANKINAVRNKLGIKTPLKTITFIDHSGKQKTITTGGGIKCKECGFAIKSPNHENGSHHKNKRKK